MFSVYPIGVLVVDETSGMYFCVYHIGVLVVHTTSGTFFVYHIGALVVQYQKDVFRLSYRSSCRG